MIMFLLLMAPVPPPKPIVVSNLVGEWELHTTDNTKYYVRLEKNNYYSAESKIYQKKFIGMWKFDNNILCINEWDEIITDQPLRSWKMKVLKEKGILMAISESGNRYEYKLLNHKPFKP